MLPATAVCLCVLVCEIVCVFTCQNALMSTFFTGQLNYVPTITFINVQKRHHAVFFPGRAGDRNGNPLPGTCVDSIVVDPRDADFYLYSHATIIGTGRPCHNHILLNEGEFTMPEIERISFCLAHLYQRCPKSVSIPAPQVR